MKSKILFFLPIFIFLFSCQKAKQETIRNESLQIQQGVEENLATANQLSQQLAKLINENDPRRETYLTLLQNLKQRAYSLAVWQDSLKTMETLRSQHNGSAVIQHLTNEKEVIDSLGSQLAQDISRAKEFLAAKN